MLPNAICRFTVTPMKLPAAFLTVLEEKNSQFIWTLKRLQIGKTVLRKKNIAGRINPTDFRLYYKAAVLNYGTGTKARNLEKLNRKQSPEINPCTNEYLIFYKGDKNMKWGKDSPFSKWCQENWSVTWDRKSVRHN